MTDDGFTADEERVLRTLLDDILPPSDDGRLPGAGTIGLAAHIVRTVRKTPMLRPVVEYGLGALADLAAKRSPGGWPALSKQERSAVLEDFTATDQFFLPAFLFLLYSGYYQHPRVVEALGLEARAPHPKGFAMEADDWTVLEPVRTRGKTYRDPS
ncbi:MAG TPA: gluconate 2-dehydrogenase subunit 3 family protein [Candidatus Binatus sp.]|nr:gluconate 2-dehydrogenase subunit 3 family protein [Candidatus Binatus sp.]